MHMHLSRESVRERKREVMHARTVRVREREMRTTNTHTTHTKSAIKFILIPLLVILLATC